MATSRVVGLVIQFFAIRVYFDLLGGAGFGICNALVNLQRFVALADLGLPESTNRQMAAAWAEGDDQKGLRVWNTHKRIIGVAFVLIVILYVALSALYPMREVHLTGWPRVNIFLFAGIAMGLVYLIAGYGSWFTSRRQFGPVAKANLWVSVGGSAFSVLFVYLLRTPVAYFYGFVCGAGCGVLSLIWRRRGELSSRAVPGFDRAVFAEARSFGLRALANKLSSALGNGADRVVIHQKLGESAIAQYNVSLRAPEAAYDALPLYQIISPELVAAQAKGQAEFSKAIDHCLRIALLIGICGIAIPCMYGYGILPILVGKKTAFSLELPIVMAGLGIYRMFECLYSAVAVIIYAKGSPEKIVPFTLWNALATLFLSYPAVLWKGLTGIVIMNLGIMVLQFIPLMVMTLRTCAPELPRWPLIRTFIVMIGLGVLVGSGAFAVAKFGYEQGWGLATVLTAPLFMGLALVLFVKTGLAEAPAVITKRLRFLRSRSGT